MLAAVAGALSIVAQSVLVRELAVLFRNNELVLGIILGSWLAGSGAGAAGLRFLPSGLRWRAGWLLFSQMVLVIGGVFATRWLFGVWQFHARPPLPVVIAIAFAITAPAGALAGLTFASLAVFRPDARGSAVYVAEAAGACGGGLAYFALLAAGWHAVDVSLAALFLVTAFLINLGRVRPWPRLAASVIVPALGLWVCLPLLRSADVWARKLQYRRTPLVFSVESRWGHLALVGGSGEGVFYYNGEVAVQRDRMAEEEDSLMPVLAAGVPESVLVLGFVPDSVVQAWRELGVKRVTAILPDRTLTLFEDYGAGRSPGFQWSALFADPFRWRSVVKDRFDLAVIREPLPVTIAANRFHARSWLAGLKAALSPRGVIAVALPYTENALDRSTARALGIVRATWKAAYPGAGFVPATRCWFFASEAPLRIGEADAQKRWTALRRKARFVNPAWIRHVFDPDRHARIAAQIDAAGPAPVNGLFTMNLFRDVLRGWVRRDLGGEGPLVMAILVVAVVTAGVSRWIRGVMARRDRGSIWIAAAGFAGMAGEVELLLWYQGVTGVVYDLFGALTALFMLGMAAGGALGLAGAPGSRGARFAGGWLAVWVAMVGSLFLIRGVPGETAANAAAFSLSLLGGAALGAVFTAASRQREGGGAGSEAVPVFYAADLAGSALAAVLVPVLLIPGIGLTATAGISLVVLAAGHTAARGSTWE